LVNEAQKKQREISNKMSGDGEELVYEEFDENEQNNEKGNGAAKNTEESGKDTYVAMHNSTFREFLLKSELLLAITDCGFEHPSEVQHQCIPQSILGQDVICQAKSGMGKTAVFVLAVLQQVDPKPNEANTLVLCHTRELAYQICHEFDRFKKYLPGITAGVFYGGIPVTQHRDQLRKETPNIVIGTPGRILQLANEKSLKLSGVKHFVLDECDKLLEQLDMRKDVQKIFRMTPHNKQVMMFSATLSEEIRDVCKKFMHNPLEIYVNDGSKLTLHGLQQYYISIQEHEKNKKLFALLDDLEFNQLIIFVKSVSRAIELNRLLIDGKFPSITIHAKLEQKERIERYKKFKEFNSRIMVATDLFGRGIDIERVNVVINYDMPDSADSYLHRVGRAGRFGTKGLAISFVSAEADADVLNAVQKRFTVNIPTLPDEIDVSSYMNS